MPVLQNPDMSQVQAIGKAIEASDAQKLRDTIAEPIVNVANAIQSGTSGTSDKVLENFMANDELLNNLLNLVDEVSSIEHGNSGIGSGIVSSSSCGKSSDITSNKVPEIGFEIDSGESSDALAKIPDQPPRSNASSVSRLAIDDDAMEDVPSLDTDLSSPIMHQDDPEPPELPEPEVTLQSDPKTVQTEISETAPVSVLTASPVPSVSPCRPIQRPESGLSTSGSDTYLSENEVVSNKSPKIVTKPALLQSKSPELKKSPMKSKSFFFHERI